jgi:hypothetical protein
MQYCRYAARALFQESPLWWTNDMPRLVTEERKDRFLQVSLQMSIRLEPGPHDHDAHVGLHY